MFLQNYWTFQAQCKYIKKLSSCHTFPRSSIDRYSRLALWSKTAYRSNLGLVWMPIKGSAMLPFPAHPSAPPDSPTLGWKWGGSPLLCQGLHTNAHRQLPSRIGAYHSCNYFLIIIWHFWESYGNSVLI